MFGLPIVLSGLQACFAVVCTLVIVCVVIAIFGGDDFDK